MRVIAGAWGGRRLVAPRGSVTRPTSDRVREAVLMALEPLEGCVVVDLFAGSGGLGIEALSRGAAHAHFVETDHRALAALATNLEALGAVERATVWRLELPRGLDRIAAPLAHADVVFADPPYGGDPARRVLAALGEPARLRGGARVVLEHHTKDVLPERVGALERVRSRRYGETQVSWYDADRGAPPLHEGEQS